MSISAADASNGIQHLKLKSQRLLQPRQQTLVSDPDDHRCRFGHPLSFPISLSAWLWEPRLCILQIVSLWSLILWRSGFRRNRTKERLSKNLEESSFFTSPSLVPLLEEGIFRGIVQPLLTRAIQIIVPAAAAVAFGPFSIAATVSIVASGIIFRRRPLFQ